MGRCRGWAGARHVFNIRASYADEADKLVQHLATIGIRHIAIAYQNNTFGREVLPGPIGYAPGQAA